MKPDQCPAADYNLVPGPDQFEHILRLRRSTRRFKRKTPDKELIERLISMAGYAPSGHNSQPVNWQVFSNRDDINRMVDMVCDWMKHMLTEMPEAPHAPVFKEVVNAWADDRDLVLHQTPVLLIAHSTVQVGTELTDAAIALGYLDLAALSLDLGCCWAGLFTMAAKFWKPLGEFLDLPKGHQMHGAMMAGYPKLKFHRLPVRKKSEIQWR